MGGEVRHESDALISRLVFDTRLLVEPEGTLFFALKSDHKDGHSYIVNAYDKGVRHFVVNRSFIIPREFDDACFISVDDTLRALQILAKRHRQKYSIPVLAITGSNGKTIVKEWLSQALSFKEKITRSPRSYNSQIGVPLSLWQLNEHSTLGIFEAGISRPGEMESLSELIRPTMGLITNIGMAHQEYFVSVEQKIDEKFKLFETCDTIFLSSDNVALYNRCRELYKGKRLLSWGRAQGADLQLTDSEAAAEGLLKLRWQNKDLEIPIPFKDAISVENLLSVILFMLHTGCSEEQIKAQVMKIQPVAMRMEQKEGIEGSLIINDSYNSDITSLETALSFLEQLGRTRWSRHTLIMSDLFQTGIDNDVLYPYVAELIKRKNIDRFIGVGSELTRYSSFFGADSLFFAGTEALLEALPTISFKGHALLIKGARIFRFERLVEKLELKQHSTLLEIDMDALVNNFNVFRAKLKPGVKSLAMVKAFGYGSGLYEISAALQNAKVDYLGVAFADEGVELRQAGVSLPIIVMNPEEKSFPLMIEYRLEPEIYSFRIMEAFNRAVDTGDDEPFPIHVKLDSGMHRLGFYEHDAEALLERLNSMKKLKVRSVFSHLAGSDDPQHDEFTLSQLRCFELFCAKLKKGLGYPFSRHILNSAGIERFPDYQYEMVRLGIGLYGISSIADTRLQNVVSLKTYISQVKTVEEGATIGYGRHGKVRAGGRIAVLPIGYADGLNRGLSNGKGRVRIGKYLLPIVGNICMDSCMVDVSDIEAHDGDEVIVFGKSPSVMDIAGALHTIPYEVLTGISRRVKRVYYKE